MFDDKENDTQQNTQAVEDKAVELPKELENLVGEGKKYSTILDALKSVEPAQNHISTIEAENAQLRAKIEELSKTPPAKEAPTTDVETIVEEALKKKDKQAELDRNQAYVVNTMVRLFGSKEEAGKEFYSRAKGLGFSEDEINNLAATKPEATLKMLDIKTNTGAGFDSIPSTLKSGSIVQPMKKPEPPKNWGNDSELAAYIRALNEYENSKK